MATSRRGRPSGCGVIHPPGILCHQSTKPAAADARAQQRVFDRFHGEYNAERPHEALGQATPASAYAPSPRPYPARLPPLEYPAHFEGRRVSRNGGVRWGVD